MTTRESDMLMDIGYQVMDANEIIELEDPFQESAFVILTGEVEIRWDDKKEIMRRESLIDENPFCLQVPRAKKVWIKAKVASEVLIQKTMNDRDFAPVFYRPEDVQCDIFGQGMWNATAERTVRTIFDYGNAPFSNQVNGEVINSPGRWSGYIPHNHPQPEFTLTNLTSRKDSARRLSATTHLKSLTTAGLKFPADLCTRKLRLPATQCGIRG